MEPVYTESQEGDLLSFIYKGAPAHHSPEVLFISVGNSITLVFTTTAEQ